MISNTKCTEAKTIGKFSTTLYHETHNHEKDVMLSFDFPTYILRPTTYNLQTASDCELQEAPEQQQQTDSR